MFSLEKPRGKRRWLGRPRHRGKQQLYDALKHHSYIEKTCDSPSKKATSRINNCTKDSLELNVMYSMDKKNRWSDADDVTLLSAAPESVNAEVVQRNVVDNSKFSVASRIGRSGEERAGRKLSKKAKIDDVEREKPMETVTYNIYKPHRNADVVGAKLFVGIHGFKKRRGRAKFGEKFHVEDYEDYEEEEKEEDDNDVEELQKRADKVMNLEEFFVSTRSQRKEKKASIKDSKSKSLLEIKEKPEFSSLLSIHDILYSEGFTFQAANVTMPNLNDNFNFEMEIQRLTDFQTKQLRQNQYLLDVSEACRLDGASKLGETTAVIVITYQNHKSFNFLVNSTIASHPSKRGADFLIKQIQNSSSILEAVNTITYSLWMNRKVLNAMSFSSKFYKQKTFSQMLRDTAEWESQLINMTWPNQHYHSIWANSKEISTQGTVINWKDLCDKVETATGTDKVGIKNRFLEYKEVCVVCSREKEAPELFITTDKIKCTDCLKEEFYKEFSARRIPISLDLELDHLPTFIPLPVLNSYIRALAEQVLTSDCEDEILEKCASCKSTLRFPKSIHNTKTTKTRSCPCGYTWCSTCQGPSHWPMTCREHVDWENKWTMKYAYMRAQGLGQEALLQITCSCARAIYNLRLPCETFQCPSCKHLIEFKTMKAIWKPKHPYKYPYPEYVLKGFYDKEKKHKRYFYAPIGKAKTLIYDAPWILDLDKVTELCGAARDVRFDEIAHNRLAHREHLLIRKGLLEGADLEVLGTAAYLAETVTAWMVIANRRDKNLRIQLEQILEDRRVLMGFLDSEDPEDQKEIRKTLNKLRIGIDAVIEVVEGEAKLD